jgi:hypothetical protein
MSLPGPKSPVWEEILSGKKQIQFEFLAVRIFLGAAQLKYKKDPSTLDSIVGELRNLFEINLNLPKVQADIQKLV